MSMQLTKEEQIAVLDMAIKDLKERDTAACFMYSALLLAICFHKNIEEFVDMIQIDVETIFPDFISYKPIGLGIRKVWFLDTEKDKLKRLEILNKMKTDRINGVI